jgi:hypothetical protein
MEPYPELSDSFSEYFIDGTSANRVSGKFGIALVRYP